MELDEAQRILQDAQQTYADAEAMIAEARRRVDGARLMMQAVVSMYPELASDVDIPGVTAATSGKPRGQEAVRQMLMSDDVVRGFWWPVGALVHRLKRRGWLPESDMPANAVRVAAER